MYVTKKVSLKQLLPVLAVVTVMAEQGGGGGIASIASNVNNALSAIATMMAQVGFLAGFIFLMAGFAKLKQHKDNPTQVPVGTPIMMFVIGAGLMFVGNFIQPLGETLFGSDAEVGGQSSAVKSGFETGA